MLLDINYNGYLYMQFEEKELLDAGVPSSVVQEAVITQEKLEIDKYRQYAYKKESDPLYMEWQFDQTPDKEKAWRDKVAEIKARYPLPTTE